MGSVCLARHTDNIWHRAKIVDILEDHKFTVVYDFNKKSPVTLDMEYILPLGKTWNL